MFVLATGGLLFAFEHATIAGKIVLLTLAIGSIFSWSVMVQAKPWSPFPMVGNFPLNWSATIRILILRLFASMLRSFRMSGWPTRKLCVSVKLRSRSVIRLGFRQASRQA